METLSTLHPVLAAEYSPSNPKSFNDYLGGSNKKVTWICSKDSRHIWDAMIAKRVLSGRGCPYCSGNKILPGVNDFATLYPDEAKYWSPKNENGPENYAPMSDYKALFVCDKGHEVKSQIKARTIGRSCAYCAGKYAYPGESDLATLHPEIASEWSPSNAKPPTQYRPKSSAKVEWVCSLGHRYTATVAQRVGNSSGCSLCSGNRSVTTAEELESLMPSFGKLWGDRNLDEDFNQKGRKGRFWLKCVNGLDHEYITNISNLKVGKGCAVCYNRQIIVGYNDAETTHPQLLSEWSEKNSQQISSYVAGSNKSFWWKCVDGHEWEATLNHRAYGDQTGCPVCSMRSSRVEEHMGLVVEEYGDVVRQAKTTSKWGGGQRMTVDALLEGKVCFEYDGRYWHSDKLEIDTRKTKRLLQDGYIVVRFRDTIGLLDLEHDNLLQVPVVWVKDSTHVEKPIREAMEWVKTKVNFTK